MVTGIFKDRKKQKLHLKKIHPLGGLARARKLNRKRRQEIAIKAVKARWEKYYAKMSKVPKKVSSKGNVSETL